MPSVAWGVTVQGVVTDREGNALDGTVITIDGIDGSTKSDADGSFELDVPAKVAPYSGETFDKIQVTKDGYIVYRSLIDLKNVVDVPLTIAMHRTAAVVTDVDGNEYQAVRLGNQLWTVTNLRTTKFSDGTPIPCVPQKGEWDKQTTPAYCWVKLTEDPKLREKYGACYNWYAIETGKLAPKDWRIPSDDDFTELEDFLTLNGYGSSGTITGNHLAKTLASREWPVWGDDFPVSFSQHHPPSNNSSGFAAYPLGSRKVEHRTDFEAFHFRYRTLTATQWNSDQAIGRGIGYYFTRWAKAPKAEGRCVRIVKHVEDPATNMPEQVYARQLERRQKTERAAELTLKVEGGIKAHTIQSAGTVKDVDGNVYQTVRIGEQVWTVDNLRTTKYNDGKPIPHVKDAAAWKALRRNFKAGDAYCFYNNTTDPAEQRKWGALYNSIALGGDGKGFKRGNRLAPAGWRVATQADWEKLLEYLADQQRESADVGKAIAARFGWQASGIAGHVGCDPAENNSSGFTGMAGGFRHETGIFLNRGNMAAWLVDDVDANQYTVFCYLNSHADTVKFSTSYRSTGFPVRLVKE
jgi:uncharacterized protein (TIGR02145 family)